MALDTAHLLLKDHVEESRFKLARLAARRCHTHGILATTKYNVVLEGRDGRGVDRSRSLVFLQLAERFCIEQHAAGVLGRCDEHRLIRRKLNVVNATAMLIRVQNTFASLQQRGTNNAVSANSMCRELGHSNAPTPTQYLWLLILPCLPACLFP